VKHLARLGPSVACVAFAAATGLASATSASAAPPADGCPTGYQLLSVPALSAQGYQVPAAIDSPTAGLVGHGLGKGQSWVQQPGNGDGWVCARQLGNQLTPWGDPIFDFVDNQLPAST
jgi:hypothetical protein